MFKVSLISLLFLPLTVTVAFAQANTMTSGRPSASFDLYGLDSNGRRLACDGPPRPETPHPLESVP